MLATSVLLMALEGTSEARRRRRHRSYTVSRTLGLGLILGGPTGLSVKIYLANAVAFDFAVGYYYGLGNDRGVGAHGDFLVHLDLVDTRDLDVPLYLGVGAVVVGDRDDGVNDNEDFEVGLRAPLGIAFEFGRVPLDIFLELALIVAFIDDDDDRIGVDAAAGFRVWF